MRNNGNKSKKKASEKNNSIKDKHKPKKPVNYDVNANYTLREAAGILRRSSDFVRKLAQNGRIEYRLDSAGYLFTGWALKNYSEGRCLVDVNSLKTND